MAQHPQAHDACALLAEEEAAQPEVVLEFQCDRIVVGQACQRCRGDQEGCVGGSACGGHRGGQTQFQQFRGLDRGVVHRRDLHCRAACACGEMQRARGKPARKIVGAGRRAGEVERTARSVEGIGYGEGGVQVAAALHGHGDGPAALGALGRQHGQAHRVVVEQLHQRVAGTNADRLAVTIHRGVDAQRQPLVRLGQIVISGGQGDGGAGLAGLEDDLPGCRKGLAVQAEVLGGRRLTRRKAAPGLVRVDGELVTGQQRVGDGQRLARAAAARQQDLDRAGRLGPAGIA